MTIPGNSQRQKHKILSATRRIKNAKQQKHDNSMRKMHFLLMKMPKKLKSVNVKIL